VLADEINRAWTKVRAALLEAMSALPVHHLTRASMRIWLNWCG